MQSTIIQLGSGGLVIAVTVFLCLFLYFFPTTDVLITILVAKFVKLLVTMTVASSLKRFLLCSLL